MNAVVPEVAQSRCAACGGELRADAPFRQCPRCLLDLALACNSPSESAPVCFDEDFDFELLERIGRGGMGVVYRARQKSLDRIVALKTVRLADVSTLARFRREAETAARLDHPNIVPIYEVGERDAEPFLVMRLVEGANLSQRLGDFKDERRLAELMFTVARAVDYAHRKGALHRDLKPSNILVDENGAPHLTDFGIAKMVDEQVGLTQTSEALGTPGYMAPEQAAGKGSAASDIYSLGAILYEMLTGQPPFMAATPLETLRKAAHEEPVDPREVNPRVNRDLAIIALKCLDKDPARRYASAAWLADDLDRWSRREPILARPAGPTLRARRWIARNPAVATLIGALTVGIVLTLALLAKANDEKQRKSIALAILRTETARQLQEIWASPSPYFAIKSETLAAMAGREPARLASSEARFTVAIVAEGNSLDRALQAAALLEHVENVITADTRKATRLDLRLYKAPRDAVNSLRAGEVQFVQTNAREYLRALQEGVAMQPLALLPEPNSGAVIFSRKNSGARALGNLRGKSLLLSGANSTLTFWTKVALAEAGLKGADFSKLRYIDDTATQPELGNPYSDMTPVEAVLSGQYDAAVVREKRFLEVSVTGELHSLHRFEDSALVFAARGELPAPDAAVFQKALLTRSEFKPASEKDFLSMSNRLSAEQRFHAP